MLELTGRALPKVTDIDKLAPDGTVMPLARYEKQRYDKATRRIEEISQTIYDYGIEFGGILCMVKEQCLYREEHDTFTQFVAKHCPFDLRRAQQLMAAYRTQEAIMGIPELKKQIPDGKLSERQLRPLADLNEREILDVIAKACERAVPASNGQPKLTSKLLAEVKKELIKPKEEKKTSEAKAPPKKEPKKDRAFFKRQAMRECESLVRTVCDLKDKSYGKTEFAKLDKILEQCWEILKRW